MELREALTEAMENTPMAGEPEVTAALPAETASEAAARERDAQGRFAPNSTAQESSPGTAPAAPSPVASSPAAVEPRKAPTSWKKEMWDHYGKLSPEVQDYIDLRERQAMEGIAPHKQAADQARAEVEASRELRAAIQPFEQDLSAHGLKPAEWVRSLGQAQLVLAKGTPDQKMGMFQNLLRGAMGEHAQIAVRDAQGNWQLSAPIQNQPQQPSLTQDDIRRMVREEQEQAGVQTTLQTFLSEVPTKYPHYEAVKPSMAGLLQSGLAQDLPSAYEAALRLPAHAAIFQEVQKQTLAADESRKATERAEAAKRARANNLSPRSVTPTTTAASGKKGLRAHLEEAADMHMSRV